MLELPRELYLIICSDLTPTELAKLAGVTRDHYLAVQQPLYARVKITKYSNLIKLVDTLRRVPVVSTISPQQRLRWHKLSDAELRERDIRHLDLLLDSSMDGHRITGAIVANCIGAISRTCQNAKISLTCNGVWRDFTKQFAMVGMPNVVDLALFSGASAHQHLTAGLWDLLFSGSTFADLKKVYLCSEFATGDDLPRTLQESVGSAVAVHASTLWARDRKWQPSTQAMPFYALRSLEEIVLAHNTFLTVDVMESLFGSDIIPQRLRKLEIVNCPTLHPVKHLSALSTLLQRALQLVQHLKLHLCKLPNFDRADTFLDNQYNARISEHPEEHPCAIIRELGQNMRHLDLALPFACNRIFTIPAKKARFTATARDYPGIPQEPHETLPERLIAAGYRYRRLITWHGVCRSAHRWYEMMETADGQDARGVSWELLHPPEEHGSWHVSGCARIDFNANDVLQRPLAVKEPAQ